MIDQDLEKKEKYKGRQRGQKKYEGVAAKRKKPYLWNTSRGAEEGTET